MDHLRDQWQRAASPVGPTPSLDYWIEEIFHGAEPSSDQFILHAMHQGRSVGYIDYGLWSSDIEILMLFVEPSWRRRGIASAMMERLQREYPSKTIDYGEFTDQGAQWARSRGIPMMAKIAGMWRPVMSREQAQRWAAGSAITEPWYHGTHLRSGADVLTEGFQATNPGQQVYGTGVYLTETIRHAIGFGGHALECVVKVNRVETVMKKAPMTQWPDLSDLPAHDALLIKPRNWGDDYLVVRDPRNVVIVQESIPEGVQASLERVHSRRRREESR